ncbi:MAG: flagellar motor stator protein MotA, partial [Thiobacillus sp.]|nr:flagellar motor stator protein MotA [Thiobacillus sp.]
MLVIVGYVVVLLCVFGGYALAGGYLAALWHPIELIIIGGGALGAFIVGNNSKALKATLSTLPTVFKGSKYTRALYLDMMALLYELLTKIRKEG